VVDLIRALEPLKTDRFAPATLLSTPRPVPVCATVPRFVRMEVPVIVTAAVLPLVIVRFPFVVTRPVPLETVCGVLEFPLMTNCARAWRLARQSTAPHAVKIRR